MASLNNSSMPSSSALLPLSSSSSLLPEAPSSSFPSLPVPIRRVSVISEPNTPLTDGKNMISFPSRPLFPLPQHNDHEEIQAAQVQSATAHDHSSSARSFKKRISARFAAECDNEESSSSSIEVAMMGYPSITNTSSSKTASTIKNNSAVSEVAAIFDDMDDDGVFNHFSDVNQQKNMKKMKSKKKKSNKSLKKKSIVAVSATTKSTASGVTLNAALSASASIAAASNIFDGIDDSLFHHFTDKKQSNNTKKTLKSTSTSGIDDITAAATFLKTLKDDGGLMASMMMFQQQPEQQQITVRSVSMSGVSTKAAAAADSCITTCNASSSATSATAKRKRKLQKKRTRQQEAATTTAAVVASHVTPPRRVSLEQQTPPAALSSSSYVSHISSSSSSSDDDDNDSQEELSRPKKKIKNSNNKTNSTTESMMLSSTSLTSEASASTVVGWDKKWMIMFRELVEYKNKHNGSTQVSQQHTGDSNDSASVADDCVNDDTSSSYHKLGDWVKTQRRQYVKGELSERRIKLLNSISFVWKVYESTWNIMYNELLVYIKKHPDSANMKTSTSATFVPRKQYPKLGEWVNTQRTQYMRNELLPSRTKLLNDINFIWKDINLIKWMDMYNQLLEYKTQNKGKTMVPNPYKKNPKLGEWVRTQRVMYTTEILSESRIHLLEKIGFVWKAYSSKWMEMYSRLIEYKTKNGHCLVPFKYTLDPSLGRWVGYNRGHCKDIKRKKLLNDIDFIWNPLSK